MKKLLILTLLSLFLGIPIFAQNNSVFKKHEFKGVIKTQDSEVVAAVTLNFKNAEQLFTARTNVNGEFRAELPAGQYEVTVMDALSKNFKAFIKIQDEGANPNNVNFTIKLNKNLCGLEELNENESCPNPIKFPTLIYPPAALAARIEGSIIVNVNIDKNGKVISANALNGPLILKNSSAKMAKQIIYEPLNNNEEREVLLLFVYINETPNKNLTIYKNPYRILVIDDREIIQTVSH